ncbi:mitochondrial processing peptidase alpha subunit, putative [Babesia caballi]|uniref:Mitochondrial processing peptidase alpha subunit, putative n=1 Tax=Babesia caballi TaxID=5871 RepID=A0AAV4LNQ8_BABCB|nr:mitochondrial processing peptidase alpha subunit, putative [Babesia caballi]
MFTYQNCSGGRGPARPLASLSPRRGRCAGVAARSAASSCCISGHVCDVSTEAAARRAGRVVWCLPATESSLPFAGIEDAAFTPNFAAAAAGQSSARAQGHGTLPQRSRRPRNAALLLHISPTNDAFISLVCLISSQSTAAGGVAEISNILKKSPPAYLHVPFVEEDLERVMDEVPDFKFYYVGRSDGGDNPYRNVPLTQSIYVEGSEGRFEPVDQSVKFAKLPNGLRIASVDKGGMDSLLGLYVGTGSRYENADELGVSAMIENMAFHSTAHLSHLRTIKTVETLGGNASCNAFREHIAYHGECLRKDVPIMVNLLIGNVLFPRFLPWEMKANKDRLNERRKQIQEAPDVFVTELLHSVAWHNNTLGLSNFCPEASVGSYKPEVLRNFMLRHFSPDNCVVVGINTDMAELSKWVMRAYNEYNAIEPVRREVERPVYTGGVRYHEDNTPLLHLAVGFEINGGWNTPDLVVFTVLQALLGGGGAFSTGGPGKGMHSRLFLNVLNKHEFAESCMAFSTVYSDTGIFGLYMVAAPQASRGAIEALAKELSNMANVTPKELERAKNSLKSFLHMSLEHKAVQMEDIARQLLLCDRVLTAPELERAIDCVTVDDIKISVQRMLRSSKPSVVALGNLTFMPHPDDLLKYFQF